MTAPKKDVVSPLKGESVDLDFRVPEVDHSAKADKDRIMLVKSSPNANPID